MSRLVLNLTFSVILWAPNVWAAEEPKTFIRGTDGLFAVPFAAANRGSEPIACSAALAHWYSVDLGRAAPGAAVRATFWYDPATGNLFVLNAIEDRMPIQSLWCGFDGRSWATRAPIKLERAAGHGPAPMKITCAPSGANLSCR